MRADVLVVGPRTALKKREMRKSALSILLILLATCEALAASKLLNYENRVVRAAEQVERIKTDKAYSEEGVDYIKRLLPQREDVQFEEHTISVDNKWLYVSLDSYAAENDPQQSLAKLNEIAGRLRALDEQLRGAETSSGLQPGRRDKINEILSRPAYQPETETAAGSFVKRLLKKVRGFVVEVLSSLGRLIEKIFGVSSSNSLVSKIVLVLVAVAALIVGVTMIRKLRLPKRKRKTRLVLGEEVSAESTSRDLAEAGLAAARSGNFRMAVRKLYVSLLYELFEKDLIELEDSATNHEYLSKVAGFAALAGPMRYLTERFDCVWYGMFPSSADDFAAYLASYEEAMRGVQVTAAHAASTG